MRPWTDSTRVHKLHGDFVGRRRTEKRLGIVHVGSTLRTSQTTGEGKPMNATPLAQLSGIGVLSAAAFVSGCNNGSGRAGPGGPNTPPGPPLEKGIQGANQIP